MVDLIATSPCAGLLPVTEGGVSLREVDLGQITSIAPLNGKEKTVNTALMKACKVALPKPGKSQSKDEARIIWTGRGQYFLIGATAPKLAAAISDQSDGWACVALEGDGVDAILARVCPLDTRGMAAGDVARSLIGHMMAVLLRTDSGYQIMVFRAFADNLVHELSRAMGSVAAQKGMSG